jgi:hypothetical protein
MQRLNQSLTVRLPAATEGAQLRCRAQAFPPPPTVME